MSAGCMSTSARRIDSQLVRAADVVRVGVGDHDPVQLADRAADARQVALEPPPGAGQAGIDESDLALAGEEPLRAAQGDGVQAWVRSPSVRR